MSVEEGVLLGFSGTSQPVAFVLPSINEIVFAIIFILLTVIVAFVVIKIIQRTVKKALERKDINPDMKYITVKAVAWIGWFFVILWILAEFGQQELVVAMFASGGIIGLAIALAAKDSLAGIFSGLFLLQNKDFSVGDEIKVANVKGKIIEVGLRKTRIRLSNGTIEIVPNSKIDSIGWTLIEKKK